MKRLTKASIKKLAKCDVFLTNKYCLGLWFAPRNGGPLEVLVNGAHDSCPEWQPSVMKSMQDVLTNTRIIYVIEVLE